MSARSLAGEPVEELEDVSAELEEDEEEASELGMLQHTFHLRENLRVTLELPRDLSGNEAERIAAFIKTLPFE